MTECSQSEFSFEVHFSRWVVGRFDGAPMTTDGGGLEVFSMAEITRKRVGEQQLNQGMNDCVDFVQNVL